MSTALNLSPEDHHLIALLTGRAAAGRRETQAAYVSMNNNDLFDTFLRIGGNAQIIADDFFQNPGAASDTPTVAEHLVALMTRPAIVAIVESYAASERVGVEEIVYNTVAGFDRVWPGQERATKIDRVYAPLIAAERAALDAIISDQLKS